MFAIFACFLAFLSGGFGLGLGIVADRLTFGRTYERTIDNLAAIAVPAVSLVLNVIALQQILACAPTLRGRGIAIAGTVISLFFLVLLFFSGA
jgi:hypothetical protein